MPESKKKSPPKIESVHANRKALFDFEVLETFEAGIKLLGWEVKSLRAGKCQLVDSYVLIKDGEAFLLGAHMSPLPSTSTLRSYELRLAGQPNGRD